VSGPISGTWIKAGSPYVAIDNCTVPAGQTLTIQPGVTLIVGNDLGIDVPGRILAIGTPVEPVVIKGPPSTRWRRIHITYGGGESVFKYCDFSGAQTALSFRIYAVNATMTAAIANCRFSNCSDSGIYGDSEGYGYYSYAENFYYQPTLNLTIKNCRFSSSSYGCRFLAHGLSWWDSWWRVTRYAFASVNPSLANNIFESITLTAASFEIGNCAGNSTAQIINTVISGCSNGVVTVDPYDTTIWNSIIQNCTNGVRRTGSLSSQVGYNCLFGNRTNFTGYPGVFGQIVFQNNNGTPCDVAYNIFQNPACVDSTNLALSASSPCIDAGDPAGAYLDGCFPPSQGTPFNDIGVYGGPYACNWLTNTGTNFSLTAQKFVGVTITPSAAGRYRLEYVDSLVAPPTNGPWTQATNLMLLSTPHTYIDFSSPTTGKRFYRAVLLP
jgi:hypothetical protein